MKLLTVVCALVFVAVLPACSGVNVGNALSADIHFGSDDSAAPTSSSGLSSPLRLFTTPRDLLSTSVATTVTKLEINVGVLGLPPQSECTQAPKGPFSDWVRAKPNMTVDLLDQSSSEAVGLEIPEGFSTCQVRMILLPRIENGVVVPSLKIEGSSVLGRTFTISTTAALPVVLRSNEKLDLSQGEVPGLEVVLHRNGLLSEIDIDAVVGADPLVITPSDHPLVFLAVLGDLRRAFRGYRLIKSDAGQAQGDRTRPVTAGDEAEENLVDGEDQ